MRDYGNMSKLRIQYNINMNQIEYIQQLISSGKWSFTTSDIAEMMDRDFYGKLHYLRQADRVINPARGFYVIVPEEYLHTDRLPVERYIDAMMAHIEQSYYVGLLTASSFYGASHQSPQNFQVMVSKMRRETIVGRNQIHYYQKRNLNDIPTAKRKTSTGYFNISTPEVTLFDLVEFHKQVGGLEQVGLIAMELSEKIDNTVLVETAEYYPMPIVQRVGYLLDVIGQEDLSDNLAEFIRITNPVYSFFNPSENRERTNKNARWKLFINEELEFDL